MARSACCAFNERQRLSKAKTAATKCLLIDISAETAANLNLGLNSAVAKQSSAVAMATVYLSRLKKERPRAAKQREAPPISQYG
jgi:hypothetical protein